MSPEKLFLILLNRSLAAGWLVLALILLRPFLRRVSRSLCCAMWGLVAFRLLCPFSFQSVLSLIPSAEPIPTNFSSGQTVISDGGLFVAEQTGSPLAPAPSVMEPATVSTAQVLSRVVTGIWFIGFTLFLLYALLSTLRLYVRVRDSVKQEEGYWMCDWINAPFVFGVFRPRIILPFHVDRRDIPYILAHERAHLARHDHWRKPIAFLLLAVFWFQPVFWVAYYLLRRDVEFACDERAILSLGTGKESKAGYAKALLKSSSPKFHVAKLSGPLAFGGLQVKRRVTSVLTYKKPAAVRLLAALLVCAVVAVCFLTDPKVSADSLTEASVDAQESPGEETPPKEPSHEAKEPANIHETNHTLPNREPVDPEAYLAAGNTLAYCVAHFDLFDTQKEHTFLYENNGDQDGSITLYVVYQAYDLNGGADAFLTLGSEVVTIEIPAGVMTAYTFDPGYSFGPMCCEIIGASYGDVTWSYR